MRQQVYRLSPDERRVIVRRSAEVHKALLLILEARGIQVDELAGRVMLDETLSSAYVEVPTLPGVALDETDGSTQAGS